MVKIIVEAETVEELSQILDAVEIEIEAEEEEAVEEEEAEKEGERPI